MSGSPPLATFSIMVGEKIIFGLDFSLWLQQGWRPGALVAVDFSVRPSLPNGFQYECVRPGQCGNIEPTWPLHLSGVVADGTTEWAAEPIDSTSLASTISSVSWSAPTGIVVSSAALSGQIATALLDFTSALSGSTYLVNIAATMLNGEVNSPLRSSPKGAK